MKPIVKILAMPAGLLIGLLAALIVPCNGTVITVVIFCAGVAALAWVKGRWVL